MNLKVDLIVQCIITAWLTLYFTNNKKYLPLKTLFEDLQNGRHLRDKKKKAKETSSQGKYTYLIAADKMTTQTTTQGQSGTPEE